jgi:hypothetical protein
MTENEDETRMTITGGCRCGAVRYAIEAEPLFARHCWCRDCQYIGAGSGTVNVFFASEKVAVEGALTDYTSHADSGTLMHRQFCAICGTPMFTQAETRKHTIGVRAGTLDEPDLGKPQITIWTSSAPNWACFDPNPICRARRKAALHLLQHRHQTPELAVAPHDGGPEKD